MSRESANQPQRIAIFGATGSIGQNALEVVRAHPDRFKITALTAGSNWKNMLALAHEFHPRLIAIADENAYAELRKNLPDVRLLCGPEGLLEIATSPEVDIVISAIVGGAGLPSTLAAVRAGKRLALANKEPLVMAGQLIMEEAKRSGAAIIPVDSEHSAIFQCLQAGKRNEVKRLVLTASGGPFWKTPRQDFARIKPSDALKHPTWDMGAKITIDSATLMNKALEIIEARWLFDMPYEQIGVLIHPQSIVHSLVEYIDGSVMAQLGVPDMKVPIQYALTYPERLKGLSPTPNLAQVSKLEFHEPRREDFPTLDLAYHVGRAGGTVPAVFNAANEIAVKAFLDGKIAFTDIFDRLARAVERHQVIANPTLAQILEVDEQTRREAACGLAQKC